MACKLIRVKVATGIGRLRTPVVFHEKLVVTKLANIFPIIMKPEDLFITMLTKAHRWT
jgi:hypothetical protein